MFCRALTLMLTMSTITLGEMTLPDSVKTNIERRIDHGLNAGIVVGLVEERDGKAATEYWSFGVTKAGESRKIDENTIFEIGSITKAFTGILLADMVERGEVKLIDPIDTYLPKGVTAPSRDGKSITLESLATHRSGLPRLPDNLTISDSSDPYADYSPDLLHAFLSKHELSRGVGEKYEYSNLGMGLLGHLLGQAAKQSYESLVVERICKPLKLKDTRMNLNRRQAKRFATGHVGVDPVEHWTMQDCLASCGALRSSAKDMIRFLSANLGLAKSSPMDALKMAQARRHNAGTADVHVGLGWHINTRFNRTIVWHNGGTGGFRTFCGFDPQSKRGVVVLSNTSNSVDDIGFHLLEPKYTLESIPDKAVVPVDVLAEYAGYYELQPSVIIHVTADGKRLFAQLTGQERYEVYAESPTTFFYTVVDAKLIFDRDDAGKVHQVQLDQFGVKRPAKRLENYEPPVRNVIEVDTETLKRYEGRYQLGPGAIIDVALDGDQLTAQITGQPRFPIFAETKTRFFYKVVDAQIDFSADDDGKASKLTLHQGGMDHHAGRLK